MFINVLQLAFVASYIGIWFDVGGVTQSSSPAKISVGILTSSAAEIADGEVSAAAKLIRVIIDDELSVELKNEAPPPIECPIMADLGITELKKI